MTTDTLRALHAAILANPDEDTPRLMYADALDELELVRRQCPQCVRVMAPECRACGGDGFNGDVHSLRSCVYCDGAGRRRPKCKTCDRTGEVLDTSNSDRAELIRVQVEVPNLPHHTRWKTLADRQDSILAAHSDWLPPCPACRVDTVHTVDDADCSHCHGEGRIGTFNRGFLSVPVPSLVALWDHPRSGKGKRYWQLQLTAWGRALRDGFPWVVEVPVADKRLYRESTREAPTWFEQHPNTADNEVMPWVLPTLIFESLWNDGKCEPLADGNGRMASYPTPDAANRALTSAVARAVFDNLFGD